MKDLLRKSFINPAFAHTALRLVVEAGHPARTSRAAPCARAERGLPFGVAPSETFGVS